MLSFVGLHMKEEWKNIEGWEGIYQISNYGRLKSFKMFKEGYILSNKNKKGDYFSVVLCSCDRPPKYIRIHRLVAEAFIPNPLNLPEVNHKDSNKQNDHVGNLEWITRLGNHRHAIENNPGILAGMIHYNKVVRPIPVKQLTMDGKILKIYPNCKEAGRKTGVCYRNIYGVASKEEYKPGLTRKQAGGFIWEFYCGEI